MSLQIWAVEVWVPEAVTANTFKTQESKQNTATHTCSFAAGLLLIQQTAGNGAIGGCCDASAASIPRVARGSREGDRVAHVGEAGRIGDRALEAKAEAGVRYRAVAPEVAVPGVVLLVDAALGHARVE